MNRLIGLQSLMLEEIEKHVKLVPQRDEPAEWERVHIASCAAIGHILAEKRGIDAELAACACAVHDYGRIVTGKQADHAQAGYEPKLEARLRKSSKMPMCWICISTDMSFQGKNRKRDLKPC